MIMMSQCLVVAICEAGASPSSPSVEDAYAAEVRSEHQQWFLSPFAYPTHTIMHYDELYKKFDAVGLYSRKSNLHMRNSSCVHFVLQGMLEKVQAGKVVRILLHHA